MLYKHNDLSISVSLYQLYVELELNEEIPHGSDHRNSCFTVFLGGSDGKESACNTGDPGSIPVLERSPGGGYGNLSSILA